MPGCCWQTTPEHLYTSGFLGKTGVLFGINFFKEEHLAVMIKHTQEQNSIPALISHSKGKFTDQTGKNPNGRT